MAHFAQLNSENVVINVIVVSNEDILDKEGMESEMVGINFCKSLYGQDTTWVQTSYNSNFRKIYARPGSIYDYERDVFYPPKPLDEIEIEWVEDWWTWVPRFKPSTDGNVYTFSHETKRWINSGPA